MGLNYDFSGWATKNDLRCSDGRTIRRDAFKDCDGLTVPLVWNHMHGGTENVLGHAMLENRPEGVYAYGLFNDTAAGRRAKEMVKHRDIKWLSIYANQLRQDGGDVIHGMIREVSLVLAGANPGATIDTVLAHSDGTDEEAIISMPEEIYHSEDEEEFEEEVEEKEENADEEEEIEHSEDSSKMAENDTRTVKDVFETFNEDQKKVVYALIAAALEDAESGNTNSEGDKEMKHNAFDPEVDSQENYLSHAEMVEAINDAKRFGSLKESFLQHGIEDVEYLFPEATNLNKTPEFIKRKDDWVGTVMNGVHHTPFSRIKSMFADITEADARAKGYIKGHYKKEEVFGLLKRTTTPTTVYKKQKMDRDDVIDITDFDVIAWLKGEMRMMLDEELARAFLIGDGRSSSSDEKINEQNIRPIWTDEDLFTIKYPITLATSATADDKAKAFIRAAVKSRIQYRGSGNPTCFLTEDFLTDMLLLEDGFGHRLYPDVGTLATAMRVKNIVTVPVMENLTREVGDKTLCLAGLIVNLDDYNVGADKGGAINMFDDFDIDYNAQKYLIETRCSGALTKPYSAIAIEVQYGLTLDMGPEDPTETLLGKSVADLQDGIIVHDNFLQGTLKYVTGYTGFSGETAEQSGNYLAVKFDAADGATTTIQLLGGDHPDRIVTLDSDMNAVIRVTNKRTNKLKVVSTLNGESITKVFSLNSLICEAE